MAGIAGFTANEPIAQPQQTLVEADGESALARHLHGTELPVEKPREFARGFDPRCEAIGHIDARVTAVVLQLDVDVGQHRAVEHAQPF